MYVYLHKMIHPWLQVLQALQLRKMADDAAIMKAQLDDLPGALPHQMESLYYVYSIYT